VALSKALSSGDTDLAYGLFSELLKKGLDECIEIAKRQPNALALLISYLRTHDSEALGEALHRLDQHAMLAQHYYELSQEESKVDVKQDLLTKVQEELEAAPSDLYASSALLVREQKSLLFAQGKYDQDVMTPLHGKGIKVSGLSLADTLLEMLAAEDTKTAGKLRSEYKVSEKKWWWLRLNAIKKMKKSDLEKCTQLQALAREKKNPIGFEPFADLCIDMGLKEEATKYIQLIQDPQVRISYYIYIDHYRDAADTAAKIKDMEELQRIFDSCKKQEDKQYIQDLLSSTRK